MAETVLRAAGDLPTAVVCDDDEVRAWADDQGAEAIWTPGPRPERRRRGGDRPPGRGAAPTGSSSPTPTCPSPPTSPGWPTPTASRSCPTATATAPTCCACPPAPASHRAYGAGSFRAHRAEAARLGLVTRLVPDAALGWDVDVPADLDVPAALDPPAYLAGAVRVPTRVPEPVSLNLPTPAVALAIGAHPDDVEFGCGATLAKWSAAGAVVHHLICTDGAKGSWDPTDGRGGARRHPPGRAARRRPRPRRHRAVRVPRLGRRRARVRRAPAVGGGVLDPEAPAHRRARPRPVEALPAPPRPPPRRAPRGGGHRGGAGPALLPRAGPPPPPARGAAAVRGRRARPRRGRRRASPTPSWPRSTPTAASSCPRWASTRRRPPTRSSASAPPSTSAPSPASPSTARLEGVAQGEAFKLIDDL